MSVKFEDQVAAAVWLRDVIVSLGYDRPDLTLNGQFWTDRSNAGDDPAFVYDAAVSISDLSMVAPGPKDREEFASRILSATISTVFRKDGHIYLNGTAPNGLRWAIDCGLGVCERVQVGTRKVSKPAPGAPMVEVEEPVFEIRCVDPLAVSA